MGDPNAALSHEWLATNGIGGYASSTVIGANTRRYHGLLVASCPPPLGRQVVLAKVDEELAIGDEIYALGSNEYHDGMVYPQGYRHLKSFRLEIGIPTFEYHIGKVTLIKQVWMEHGRNTVYIRYRLLNTQDKATLTIRPFCSFRGYHQCGQQGGQVKYSVPPQEGLVTVVSESVPYSLKMLTFPSGFFTVAEDWYWNFLYRMERDRGFACLEDLYTPGMFVANISPGETFGFSATCEEHASYPDVDGAYDYEIKRRKSLVGDETDPLRSELLLAADQFIVKSPASKSEIRNPKSAIGIIAGYHWFTEWGRDAMISLPGLLLSTKRFAEAHDILAQYIESAEEGMIPNHITDAGLVEYNTADATLWCFQALHQCVTASDDSSIIRRLFPCLAKIVDWHVKGTRFGIHVDPLDGLLFAGRSGSQVTWMDACVDGQPVTPRIGKPVEINALWYNALSLMASWAREIGESPDVYVQLESRCGMSFRRRFWHEGGGYLFDVIDGLNGADFSLRPNQIMAVSLPHSPLDPRQQKSVVGIIESHLLTPYGLRTLSPHDPAYIGRYHGGPTERDRAYHQGTVWPWLMGQFADAHYRVYHDKKQIARLLKPFLKHLSEAGVGTISEIFDGDSHHIPGGCIAQAWSVAEILRTCTYLDE